MPKFAIKSFAVKFSDYEPKINSPEQAKFILPYNVDIMSRDGARNNGSIGNTLETLPTELIPDILTDGNIHFAIEGKEDDRFNSVECRG